ncbi:hypothetical protein V1282_000402 [Nitrobacteraceae bacterium AZCC 2146]
MLRGRRSAAVPGSNRVHALAVSGLGTHIHVVGPADGAAPIRSGDPEATPRLMMASVRRLSLGTVQYPVGTSNTYAMFQPASEFTLPGMQMPISPARKNDQDGRSYAMADDEGRPGTPGGPSTSVITKVKSKTKRPNLYRVLILNDDYTPMEFVVHVLEKFFQKDVEGGDPDHAARSSSRHRRVRHLHLRDCGNQGDAGDGFCP